MNVINSLSKNLKLLFFSFKKEDFLRFSNIDLGIGIFVTWIVGMGRYWDDPGAKLLQHLGVGSVIYIFILSLLIWLLFIPFKIKDWSYKTTLTFVSFTSLPALLYAIPVERFLVVETAAAVNAYFLLSVALWRVSLYAFFLKRFAHLKLFECLVAAFLPLTAIVTTLTALNLERAVFNIMGGVIERTSKDSAYSILLFFTMSSIILIGPLVISYAVIIYKKRKQSKVIAS